MKAKAKGYMKTDMEKSPIFSVKMWNHYDNDDFSSLSFSNLRLVFIYAKN
jgi:hypothetical protein